MKFEECNMNYANFNMSNIRDTEFKSCGLNSSSFNEVKLKEVTYKETSLIRAQFVETPLKNIDLSTSNIEGILIKIQELKGLIVNDIQAIQLSKILGIIIK